MLDTLKKPVLSLLCGLLAFTLHAQTPLVSAVNVMVSPDHDSWTYQPGEPVTFTLSVWQNGHLLKGAKLHYEIGPEKQAATKQADVTLPTGTLTVAGGTLRKPGFLRCVATMEGKEVRYRGLATAGFAPERVQATTVDPADFDTFWNTAKQELAQVPLDLRLTALPERNTASVNVYQLNVQNVGNSRIYGILCVPKAPGKCPAVLRVPGAGVRAYGGDIGMAQQGVITLEIGIHGIPVNLDPSVYTSLANGPLNGYPHFNLDDRDRYYYKRVYLGCLRANDALVSLPEYDGHTLLVAGGSQGGALSIVTAALDPRVQALGAFYPALCNLNGFLEGSVGGWPGMFTGTNAATTTSPDRVRNARYFDVVNFARRLRVPGRYSWSYNDESCPPTSTFAAYNVITAPKTLDLFLDPGHWTYPEQNDRMNAWMLAQAKK